MSSNNIYKPKLTELEAYQIALTEIQRLKAENEKLKAYAPDPFDDSLPTYAQLVKDLHETESELGSVRDMLLDVAHSGVEIEFRQYTTVQINRTMWDKIQEWAKGKEVT